MCRFAGTRCGSLQSDHLIGKILVGHAPVDHGLGGLAAAGADIAQVLLLEGHAAAGQADFFLHLHLAGQVAAPHGLDVAGVGLGQLLDLLHGGGCPGALLAVGEGTLVQVLAQGLQLGGNGGLQLVQAHEHLLAGVAAHQHALVLFQILGADLQAQRHALHLPLGELPAGGVVAVIQLHAGVLADLLGQLGSLTGEGGRLQSRRQLAGIGIVGIQIVEGRFINETDVKEKRKVVVLDDLACRVLFKDGGSPVGRMVQIDKMGYTVVGTYKGLSYSYTSQIYGPLSSVLLTYMGDKRDVASISFTVRGIDTEEQSDLFKRQLRTRLGAEHSFSPEDKSAIWINDRMESYQQTMTIFHGIALFIWIIGIGTLTAGIVGVSNIMLVTVRERTSEFGIRKAMGARPSSLVKLVLLESVLITAAFGYVGLIGGVGVMEAVNFFMDRAAAASPSQFSMFKNPTLDLSTAVSATLVLIVAGMIAGYVPARRAARIKAIDAMRHNK